MLSIVALDVIAGKELVGTYHFTRKEIAEFFAEGIHMSIEESKRDYIEFRATEYIVGEDADDMAKMLGKALGFEESRIDEMINEAKGNIEE